MSTRIILLALLLLPVLTGCHSKRFSEEKQRIVVADAQQGAYGLIYIAEAQGFFADEGLAIEFRTFNIGKDALADLISGNSDMATSYTSPIIFQALAGRNVSLLGTLHRSARNTALIARTDRGIHTVDNLAGKKIGLTKGSSAEYFLSLFFTGEGLDPKSVQTVDFKVDELTPALERGEVDAVVSWGTHLPRAAKSFPGAQHVTFYSEIYPETSVLSAAPAFLAQHPDAVARFLKALVRAEQYYATHRLEADSVIKKRLQSMNGDDVQASLDVSQLMIRVDNALLYGMNDEARWLAEMQGKDGPLPQFQAQIQGTFLEQVQPLYVTLPSPK